MKKLLIAAMVVVALTGCTRPGLAERVLSEQGYTDIDAGGYGFFSCSEDDAFKTNFTATSPAGKRVEGTVCSGWFKGATIRLD
jgi:hypothetical protein